MTQQRTYEPFRRALPRAEDKEMDFAEQFLRAGYDVGRGDGDAALDFWAKHGGKPWWFEVKDESNYASSGNVCLELYQGNPRRESGLYASRAHFCIHALGDKAAVYDRQAMLRWCARSLHAEEYPLRCFGDNRNHGLVVPVSAFESMVWFDVVPQDEIPSSELFGKG